MNKYKKLLVLLLILSGIASLFIYFGSRVRQDLSRSPQVSQGFKATLIINEKSFDISSFVGKSALEATKKSATVEETGTGENAFITSLDGVPADSKKHEFWELVVNGESAQVGAGSYLLQNGDSILWKLSTY